MARLSESGGRRDVPKDHFGFVRGPLAAPGIDDASGGRVRTSRRRAATVAVVVAALVALAAVWWML